VAVLKPATPWLLIAPHSHNLAVLPLTNQKPFEDLSSGGGLVPFANFGTVQFEQSLVILYNLANGSSLVIPPDPVAFDIEQDNKVLTSSTIDDTLITVSYTGD
jgi:hypothetical protein